MDAVASRPLNTVIVSFQESSGFSTKGSSVSGPSASIFQYSGAQPWALKMPTKRGALGATSARARGASAGIIESRSGRARETPAPRRSVRREMCLRVMNMLLTGHLDGPLRLAIHLKRVAVDDAEHQRRKTVVV